MLPKDYNKNSNKLILCKREDRSRVTATMKDDENSEWGRGKKKKQCAQQNTNTRTFTIHRHDIVCPSRYRIPRCSGYYPTEQTRVEGRFREAIPSTELTRGGFRVIYRNEYSSVQIRQPITMNPRDLVIVPTS